MNFLRIRNAEHRARWTLKYFSGAQIGDAWSEYRRIFLDCALEVKRVQARKWVAKRKIEKAAGNVVPLRKILKGVSKL